MQQMLNPESHQSHRSSYDQIPKQTQTLYTLGKLGLYLSDQRKHEPDAYQSCSGSANYEPFQTGTNFIYLSVSNHIHE